MEVILQKDVVNLGRIGDRVHVKRGFARNYLIPQDVALMVSEANLAVFESRRKDLEKAAKEALAAAKKRAEELEKLTLTLGVQTSNQGKLYGSIGNAEVVKLIQDAGCEIAKNEVIIIDGSVHHVGDYEVMLQLHADVNVTLPFSVHSTTENMEEIAKAAAQAEAEAAARAAAEEATEEAQASVANAEEAEASTEAAADDSAPSEEEASS